MPQQDNIVQQASRYVYELFKKELSGKFLFHSFHHTLETVEAVSEIAENSNLDEGEREMLELAAWFHDTGYIKQYKGHEQESMAIAKEFLDKNNYSADKTGHILDLIERTNRKSTPENLMQEVMYDADIIHTGKEDFSSKSDMLRIEWETFLDKACTNEEWDKLTLDFLFNAQFLTEYAQRKYGPGRLKNIRDYKDRIGKEKSEVLKTEQKLNKKKEPGRGIETMFRAVYRNHITLSSIADSKANMMISINTIIMSIIITIVGSGFTIAGSNFYEHIRFIPPITVLLLTCLISVVFAILSARPNVTNKEITKEKVMNLEASPLYFGNFVKMELDDFQSTISRIMEAKTSLYGNMITDLYYLGKVLAKKYQLLRISYSVFMIGIVLAVILFIITFFMSLERAPAAELPLQ